MFSSWNFSQRKDLLIKCAATSLSSKLVASQKDFFAKMVVDAVMHLDEHLALNMIGIKKVNGGCLEVRISRQPLFHKSVERS